MKNKKYLKHTIKSKSAILAICGVLFLVILLLGVLEKTHVTNFIKMPAKQTTTKTGATKEQRQAEAQANADSKQRLLDNAVKNDQSSNNATPAPATDTATSTTSSASMTLTASQSGSSVTVLTQIQNVAEGTCKLVVSNGIKSTAQTAQVIYQPQFSSCAGFTVPVSSIGAGTWSIAVTVTPDDSTAITKTITLEVN
jgi:hypothetical protein